MDKVEKEQLEVETAEVATVSKKSKKWLVITIVSLIVAGIAAWCIYNAVKIGDMNKVFSISALLAMLFIITCVGYLLGRITIKDVSLGTAGVFLVAILFGFLVTLIPENTPILGQFNPASTQKGHIDIPWFKTVIQNVGLVLFVGAVGFIAGPRFFRDLKKNFKTYILLGAIVIMSGGLVAVLFALIPGIGSEFSAGVLSGALTTTPGYAAAKEVATNESLVTLGHAIAYPFGVVGVVLFVQLLPKLLKADMNKEREYLRIGINEEIKSKEGLLVCDDFGFTPLALAIVSGLILGMIKIPLTGSGFDGPCFSLGTTGGVLIMCLVFGHFGRIGKLSLEVPAHSAKVLRELGLMLFLIGAGFEGGVSLVSEVSKNESGALIVLWGFLGGFVMTTVPMLVGFVMGKYVLKLPLLNNLGSITGGMTSTPALGTLIKTADTEDVAGAYASTYPIALVLIVVICSLMVSLI